MWVRGCGACLPLAVSLLGVIYGSASSHAGYGTNPYVQRDTHSTNNAQHQEHHGRSYSQENHGRDDRNARQQQRSYSSQHVYKALHQQQYRQQTRPQHYGQEASRPSIDGASREADEAPPLPEGWGKLRANDGRPYYVFYETGVVQWERPAPIVRDSERPGTSDGSDQDGKARMGVRDGIDAPEDVARPSDVAGGDAAKEDTEVRPGESEMSDAEREQEKDSPAKGETDGAPEWHQLAGEKVSESVARAGSESRRTEDSNFGIHQSEQPAPAAPTSASRPSMSVSSDASHAGLQDERSRFTQTASGAELLASRLDGVAVHDRPLGKDEQQEPHDGLAAAAAYARAAEGVLDTRGETADWPYTSQATGAGEDEQFRRGHPDPRQHDLGRSGERPLEDTAGQGLVQSGDGREDIQGGATAYWRNTPAPGSVETPRPIGRSTHAEHDLHTLGGPGTEGERIPTNPDAHSQQMPSGGNPSGIGRPTWAQPAAASSHDSSVPFGTWDGRAQQSPDQDGARRNSGEAVRGTSAWVEPRSGHEGGRYERPKVGTHGQQWSSHEAHSESWEDTSMRGDQFRGQGQIRGQFRDYRQAQDRERVTQHPSYPPAVGQGRPQHRYPGQSSYARGKQYDQGQPHEWGRGKYQDSAGGEYDGNPTWHEDPQIRDLTSTPGHGDPERWQERVRADPSEGYRQGYRYSRDGNITPGAGSSQGARQNIQDKYGGYPVGSKALIPSRGGPQGFSDVREQGLQLVKGAWARILVSTGRTRAVLHDAKERAVDVASSASYKIKASVGGVTSRMADAMEGDGRGLPPSYGQPLQKYYNSPRGVQPDYTYGQEQVPRQEPESWGQRRRSVSDGYARTSAPGTQQPRTQYARNNGEYWGHRGDESRQSSVPRSSGQTYQRSDDVRAPYAAGRGHADQTAYNRQGRHIEAEQGRRYVDYDYGEDWRRRDDAPRGQGEMMDRGMGYDDPAARGGREEANDGRYFYSGQNQVPSREHDNATRGGGPQDKGGWQGGGGDAGYWMKRLM